MVAGKEQAFQPWLWTIPLFGPRTGQLKAIDRYYREEKRLLKHTGRSKGAKVRPGGGGIQSNSVTITCVCQLLINHLPRATCRREIDGNQISGTTFEDLMAE